MNDSAPKVGKAVLDENSSDFKFTNKSLRLGAHVYFMINDGVNTRCIIAKARKVMGVLKFVSANKEAHLGTNIQL